MNLAVTALLGYAIKEVVVPLITSEATADTKTTSQNISTEEIQSALGESQETLSFIHNILDIFA